MGKIVWKDWVFTETEDSPIFGKMVGEAVRDEIEEVFYIYCDELNEEVCEELYNEYLYSYGEE